MDSAPATNRPQTKEKPGWTAIALVAVFVLAAVGMFAVGARLVKRSPGPDVSTIAVVPFSDINPISGNPPFGALFARQLEGAVSKTDGLHLTQTPQAATLIEGSVQKSGDRVRAAVWLVRASDRRALWGQRYEFAVKDAPGAQEQIVRGVVGALHIHPGSGTPR